MAGGRGTRGRPYTDHFPKAMIPINGVPLVERIVNHIASNGHVDEIVVVADYTGLGAQIKNHLSACGARCALVFVQDSQSGTGGDLLHAAPALDSSDDSGFLLWFVDNLCALDIDAVRKRFDSGGVMACIATRSRRQEETGFARVQDGIITEFVEKPVADLPIPECLGMYMLDRGILDHIRNAKKAKKGGGGDAADVNLSFDVLQDLSRKSQVGAYDIGDAGWIDIESPVAVDRNRRLVDAITERMES